MKEHGVALRKPNAETSFRIGYGKRMGNSADPSAVVFQTKKLWLCGRGGSHVSPSDSRDSILPLFQLPFHCFALHISHCSSFLSISISRSRSSTKVLNQTIQNTHLISHIIPYTISSPRYIVFSSLRQVTRCPPWFC